MADLKILLLGGIHPSATKEFAEAGMTGVQTLKGELDESALREAVRDVHVLGIRSATRVTPAVLENAPNLLAIGCFCIGVNQVDLREAKLRGVPVFNAPFSNTRSVAELVIAEIILLLRDVPAKNAALHRGEWKKSASNSYEVRGKTLGIVGYGHIGTQVGILAEALGMRVIFFDIEKKLTLGNAQPMDSLRELLEAADVVTFHVPEDATTRNMISAKELALLKHGARLINAARGKIIDIAALTEALKSGQVAGAALDVFPQEPHSGDESFLSPLCDFENVLLTPHVGGSTAEAQENIGREVAEKLARYVQNGSTALSVNFAEVSLPKHTGKTRLLHIHRNVPGVLAAVNELFGSSGINIAAQYLQTDPDIGYVVTDIDSAPPPGMLERLRAVPGTIRTRIIS